MHLDTPLSILKSASRFFSGTLLSRITGLLRDMAMAYAFGASAEVAALMVAYRLAHLFRRLLGEGAMQMAFTPHFEELRHHDHARALAFFRDLKGTIALVLVVLIVLGMGLSQLLISTHALSPGNEEITSLFMLLLPSLLFICLFGLNAGLLQCEGHYFMSGFAPVAFNIVWCGCALAFSGLPIAQGVTWLAGGIVVACIAQWAFTLPSVKQIVRDDLPSWHPQLFSADVLAVISPFSLAVIGVAATQLNNALDVIFGRYASLSGPAYLWYAIRIEQVPLALFGIALSTALFPPLSRAIKQHQREQALSLFSFAMTSMTRLLVPMTYALLALGPQFINLIFGMGDFNKEAIIETSYCLWGYTLGLRASAAVLLIAPIFYALGNYRLPTLACIAAVTTNILFNALLVLKAGFGATSIAIATSVSSFVNLFILSYALRDLFETSLTTSVQRKTHLKTTLAALLATAATWGTEYLLSGSVSAWAILKGQDPFLPTHVLDKLWICTVPSMSFLIVYLVGAERKLWMRTGKINK